MPPQRPKYSPQEHEEFYQAQPKHVKMMLGVLGGTAPVENFTNLFGIYSNETERKFRTPSPLKKNPVPAGRPVSFETMRSALMRLQMNALKTLKSEEFLKAAGAYAKKKKIPAQPRTEAAEKKQAQIYENQPPHATSALQYVGGLEVFDAAAKKIGELKAPDPVNQGTQTPYDDLAPYLFEMQKQLAKHLVSGNFLQLLPRQKTGSKPTARGNQPRE